MKTRKACLFAAALMFTSPAMALDGVYIGNPGDLKWTVDSGRVYLRNLSSFDPTWLGCCYSYWIDISNDNGKAQFAAFLSAYYANKPFSIYKDSKAGAGAISFLGPT